MFLAPKIIRTKRLQIERFNSFAYPVALFILVEPSVNEFLDKPVGIFDEKLPNFASIVMILDVHFILPYINLSSSKKLERIS